MSDYYNCSPCDFYSHEEEVYACGYTWDETNEEYVLFEDLEDKQDDLDSLDLEDQLQHILEIN